MARRKRLAAADHVGSTIPREKAHAISVSSNWKELWQILTQPRNSKDHIKSNEWTFILGTLSTLVGNGVSLPKALGTLAREDSLARHRRMLESIRRKVEAGVTFSNAIAQFPHLCDNLTLNQIRLGERSGTLPETLRKLSTSRNKSAELRKAVMKKLAYPTLLVVVGSGLITFLLMYVVPVFQETYDQSGVPLPFITRLLIETGNAVRNYGWIVAGSVALGYLGIKQIRRREDLALKMDQALLKIPLIGNWLRDMAVLQLMEVLQNLMEAGYTLAEALRATADSVGNRAVRRGVRDLQMAVQRGEKFSRELERHENMFPPVVNQLVGVGESTGQLVQTTNDICDFLRNEIERKTTLFVGAIEPVLTISLAVAIGIVLLAIYLPMFDMVNTVSG